MAGSVEHLSEGLSSESTYLEKTPTASSRASALLAGLFLVSLTRITSVPECAVSSRGIRVGIGPPVSRTCGVSVGLARALDLSGQPTQVSSTRQKTLF